MGFRFIESMSQPLLTLVVNGYLTAIFVVIGVVFNAFSILIFIHTRQQTSLVIKYYLVALTVWETALLVNAFLLYSLPHLIYGHLIATGNYVYIYPYAYTLANATHMATVWVVIALTVDRYVAICKPMKYRLVDDQREVIKGMIFISVVAVIFSLPRFFEVHPKTDCDDSGACHSTIEPSKLVENQYYWVSYHVLFAMIFVNFGPCVMLGYLIFEIANSLRNHVRNPVKRSITRITLNPSPNASKKEKKENLLGGNNKRYVRANVILILVVIKFVIANVLPTIIDTLEHVLGASTFLNSPTITTLVIASNFLIVVNCSSNFCLFFVRSHRFRTSCREFLGIAQRQDSISRTDRSRSPMDV